MTRSLDRARTLAVLLVLSIGCRGARAQTLPDGEWAGGTNLLGGWRFAQMHVTRGPDGLSGSLDVPTANAMRLPMRDFAQQGDHVRFSVLSPLGALAFDGRLRDGVVAGNLSGAGMNGELHLVPAARIDTSLYRSYVGTYRVSDGSTLLVTFRPFGQLFATQVERAGATTGVRRVFNLIPRDSAIFFTSGSVNAAPKRDETIEFFGDSLRWNIPGTSALTAVKSIDMHEAWVVVHNGPVTLNATLYTPLGTGPFPAVVSVGGSGPTTRDAVLLRTRELVEAGLAVLVYDKRGTGDASGDWSTATPEDLASDARAAFAFLRGRAEVDTSRIGLHGHSQGGWIVPIALDSLRGARFVILSGSTPLPAPEQETYRAEATAREAKLSPQDAADAAALMRLKWRFALSGEGWSEYIAAAQAAQGRPWLSIVNPPLDSASGLWNDMRAFRGHDPQHYAERITVPTLLLYGADDDEVPSAQSIALWRAAFARAGNSQVRIEEIPGMGHSVFLRVADKRSVVAPEARAIIKDWLATLRR